MPEIEELRAKLRAMEEEDEVASRVFKELPLRVVRVTEGKVEDDDIEKTAKMSFPVFLVSSEVKSEVDAKTPMEEKEDGLSETAVVSEGNSTKGTGKRIERLVELLEEARGTERSLQRLNGLAEGDTRAGLITKAAEAEEPLAQKEKQRKADAAVLTECSLQLRNEVTKRLEMTKAERICSENRIKELNKMLEVEKQALEAKKAEEAQHEKDLDEVIFMYRDRCAKTQRIASEIKAKTENSHAFITELQVKIDELRTERGAQHAALVKVAQDVKEAFHAEHTTIMDAFENCRTIIQEWDTFQKTKKTKAFERIAEPVNQLAATRSTTIRLLSCYCNHLKQEATRLCDGIAQSQPAELKLPVYDM